MATRGVPLPAVLISRIACLTAMGWGKLRIARYLGLSTRTVRKYRPRRVVLTERKAA